ncbi:MAG: SDR family oxidoreductase [Desulfobacterales bacterium]|nr:SDR family oxidoreductase [Desulfobacterales bacterium]
MAYKPFDLKGKTALITGGNSGIGLGMADALARAGADICIWGTNPEKNKAAVKRLEIHGAKVNALQCDVSDETAVGECFSETLSIYGRVDACFANAGTGTTGMRFNEMTTKEWKRVMDINLDGFFYTMRIASRHMVERAKNGDAGGRLIGTSSLGAICGMAMAEHYAASKGAVISIMQGLAVELARFAITANSILPGHIETAMTEKRYQDEKFTNAILPRIPMRRWGNPDDFGGIAVYLMSDASCYHTGDTFLIDGGFFLN